MKTLYYGDNLEILRTKIQDNTVDLCYIDPPFNSKRSYFQIYNNLAGEIDKAQAQAFIDTWEWDTKAMQGYQEITTNQLGRFTRQAIELILGLEHVLGRGDLLAYLIHITLRVTEIYRVLKTTGSFYLHCDPTASHYLKLVLDAVFCSQGGDFKNEIIWSNESSSGFKSQAKSKFIRGHDVILFYVKNKSIFNVQTLPLSDSTIRRYDKVDEHGQAYKIYYDSNGKERIVYLSKSKGRKLSDTWTDLPSFQTVNASRENLGYETQKPEAVLERIIKTSSNEGDLVLDAYCGCGTTVAVAERLNRNWIGIDITYQSIGIMLKRLQDSFGDRILDEITVDGIPRDVESARLLATRPDDKVRKEFEKWAILTYTNNRAVINTAKGADKGIDGRVYFATSPTETARMILQVKSGGAHRGTIATLKGDMEREQAVLGTLIILDEPTKPMRDEAVSAGVYHHQLMGRDYPTIRIVTVREIIEDGLRMDLPMSYQAVKTAKKAEKETGQLEIGFNS